MKVLMFIAQKNFRDEELFDPKAVLEQAAIEVKIAAMSLALATGKFGSAVAPDFKLDEIESRFFDGLIFVGGPGAQELIKNSSVHNLARQFYHSGKLVAAICCGSAILAQAGILENKKATIAPSFENYLIENKAIFTDTDVEVDGNIITASGPAAASRFGQEIVSYLNKQKK